MENNHVARLTSDCERKRQRRLMETIEERQNRISNSSCSIDFNVSRTAEDCKKGRLKKKGYAL